MRVNKGLRVGVGGLLATMLMIAAGFGPAAAAQTKSKTAAQAKKPAAAAAPKKKAPVRRVAARPKSQMAPTRDRLVEIQEALAHEGFYSDTPSGKWDATTSQAMRNFQIAKGLSPTGKLGAQSLQKLGLGSEIAGKGAPVPQADTRPSVLSESEVNEPDPPEAAEPAAN